jgi:hypothetical protein
MTTPQEKSRCCPECSWWEPALHDCTCECHQPSPADTKVEDWEGAVRDEWDNYDNGSFNTLHGTIAFIKNLIEKVRQEEHQSVNQIYKTREEVFQEGIKMERERILAALPTPTNGLEINYRKKIERAIYQPSE